MIGGLFRPSELTQETTAEALDGFVSGAWGHRDWDLAAVVHYLSSLDQESIAHSAVTGTLGLFVDLDEFPSRRTAGLTAGCGYFTYEPRALGTITSSPHTIRADVTLSLSNVSGSSGNSTLGLGLALRFTHLWNSDVPDETRYSVLLSSDFLRLLTHLEDEGQSSVGSKQES
jgi:hypothetical protein